MGPVVTQVPLDSTLALLTRAREGDRVALELVAGRYQTALLRFAHGRVPSAARGLVDTVDIVQQAMVRTLARLDHIDSSLPGALLAYLRCAVLNQIRDEIRRARRRPQPAELDERLPALDRDPLEAVISEQEFERYNVALLQLPADQQEAFVMRIEMGCAYREIADALGRPSTEAARMLVRRAIRAVAEALRETPPA
jgi:RNA polymerase sigma-70 factor (ECF subfamily)